MSFFDRWRAGRVPNDEQYRRELERLRQAAPVPSVWLFGKTGSGKSSVVRSLTGAQEATIGEGFRPETKTSRRFAFPNEEETLLEFIDTRGVGEAHYDPSEDIKRFSNSTQLVIVTVKVTDRALAAITQSLRQIRRMWPQRPVLLVLTCLHEATPGEDITAGPDRFAVHQPTSETALDKNAADKAALDKAALDKGSDDAIDSEFRSDPSSVPQRLQAAIDQRTAELDGLFDSMVPVDITREEDGFANPDFGGERLRGAILKHLPDAYRQGLLSLSDAELNACSDRQRRARWQILASSALAGSAGAVPIPWMDIPVVIGLQYHMAIKLAKIYEQPFNASQWAALSGAAGGRVAIQLAMREALKFIPWVGIAAGAASSFAYTYAMGMSWDWYFADLRGGRVPNRDQLKEVFREQLEQGRQLWMRK